MVKDSQFQSCLLQTQPSFVCHTPCFIDLVEGVNNIAHAALIFMTEWIS